MSAYLHLQLGRLYAKNGWLFDEACRHRRALMYAGWTVEQILDEVEKLGNQHRPLTVEMMHDMVPL